MSAHQRFDQLLLREIRQLHDRTFRVISAAGATRNGMPAQIVLEQLEAIRVLLSRLKPGLGRRERKTCSTGHWSSSSWLSWPRSSVSAGSRRARAGMPKIFFFFFLFFFFVSFSPVL